MHVQAIRQGRYRLLRCECVIILDSTMLLNRIGDGESCERLREVIFRALIAKLAAATHLYRYLVK